MMNPDILPPVIDRLHPPVHDVAIDILRRDLIGYAWELPPSVFGIFDIDIQQYPAAPVRREQSPPGPDWNTHPARFAEEINGPARVRMESGNVPLSRFGNPEVERGDVGRNDEVGVIRADLRRDGDFGAPFRRLRRS